jgi:hypothetical protein
MNSINQQPIRDFSVIFKEIEDYKNENPCFNLVPDDILEHNESIKAFGEICKEINSIGDNQTVFMTFS